MIIFNNQIANPFQYHGAEKTFSMVLRISHGTARNNTIGYAMKKTLFAYAPRCQKIPGEKAKKPAITRASEHFMPSGA
ncbi:hypothetical protein QS306_08565 [Paraburkholderia bonniea]|uniref:hypothetical protein n=1 Tax=Paraburkholderia bonniea TaxID=2152891 RepID=UPI0025738C02|nr:hypothetical protein [Paraburkholderia bonniea]WJF89188.1 hypothetical protein QS306_08565 [Paraburkholderia bonniea]WJF92504.1 hypothetical protein QS308_08575 [Paraburkholderia bonniea]